MIAFDHRLAEFQKRGVEVVGVSIDSQFAHNAWKNTPINKGGIGQVGYTLFAKIQGREGETEDSTERQTDRGKKETDRQKHRQDKTIVYSVSLLPLGGGTWLYYFT